MRDAVAAAILLLAAFRPGPRTGWKAAPRRRYCIGTTHAILHPRCDECRLNGATEMSVMDSNKRLQYVDRLTDPPVARALFGKTRWAWIWLLVRLYVGYTWLSSGIGKLGSAAWTGENAGAAVTVAGLAPPVARRCFGMAFLEAVKCPTQHVQLSGSGRVVAARRSFRILPHRHSLKQFIMHSCWQVASSTPVLRRLRLADPRRKVAGWWGGSLGAARAGDPWRRSGRARR